MYEGSVARIAGPNEKHPCPDCNIGYCSQKKDTGHTKPSSCLFFNRYCDEPKCKWVPTQRWTDIDGELEWTGPGSEPDSEAESSEDCERCQNKSFVHPNGRPISQGTIFVDMK